MTTAPPTTLAEFLLARIAADEAVVQGAEPNLYERAEPWRMEAAESYGLYGMTAQRVLAECEAKRRIVGLHSAPSDLDDGCEECNLSIWPCATLISLALPYADAPGFREEWRP